MPCITHSLPMALLTFLTTAGLAGCERIEDAATRYLSRDNSDHTLLTDNGSLRVILCGTGTPQVRSPRGQACTLVSAGGRLFLFDAGENTLRNLESSYVPISGITDVFISHWHSDHFNGLGGVINHSWLNGRKTPLTVYGPAGVEDIVASYAKLYALDIGYRHTHFVAQPELATATAHRVEITPSKESVTVYDRDGVHIEAYRVAHQPVEPAFGYVVHYGGKKVFISGDTRVSDIYLPAMQDADLVVHEAINSEMTHRAAKVLTADGRTQDALPTLHVTDYHADTLQLAEMAQRAGVKHLVLTHLIPSPTNVISRWLFTRGMADIYNGEVTVGEDGMQIRLRAAAEE